MDVPSRPGPVYFAANNFCKNGDATELKKEEKFPANSSTGFVEDRRGTAGRDRGQATLCRNPPRLPQAAPSHRNSVQPSHLEAVSRRDQNEHPDPLHKIACRPPHRCRGHSGV